MNEWEAKYKALSAGVSQETVDAALSLVAKSIEISKATMYPLREILSEVLRAVDDIEARATAKRRETTAPFYDKVFFEAMEIMDEEDGLEMFYKTHKGQA